MSAVTLSGFQNFYNQSVVYPLNQVAGRVAGVTGIFYDALPATIRRPLFEALSFCLPWSLLAVAIIDSFTSIKITAVASAALGVLIVSFTILVSLTLKRGSAQELNERFLDWSYGFGSWDLGDVIFAISAGCDVNFSGSRGSRNSVALTGAIRHGHREIAQVIMDAGANLNSSDSSGQTPLMAAVERDDEEMVQRLIAAHASTHPVNSEGDTALTLAAGRGHVPILQALMAAGADVNVANRAGNTALILILAARRDPASILQALITAGADVNATNGDGKTALMIAIERGHLGAARALIEARAGVSYADLEGNTALILAARHGLRPLVGSLITAGANVNAANRAGQTALTIATEHRSARAVHLLLQAGAEVPDEYRARVGELEGIHGQALGLTSVVSSLFS